MSTKMAIISYICKKINRGNDKTHNMDYTDKEVRSKIYRERCSLDEFESDALGKLNEVLMHKIGETEVAMQMEAEQYTLDIFNNAYYITTLILTDKRRELLLGTIIKISRTGTWGDEYPLRYHFGAITMGMVSLYMYLCKPLYWEQDDCVLRTQMEELHKAIYGDDKLEQMQNQFYGDNFFMMAERDEYVADWFVSEKPLISQEVACSVFAPLAETSVSECVTSENRKEALLLAKIEELQKRVADLEELRQPIEEISADQKVRMELGCLLMESAGWNWKERKHGEGKKAAQLLSLLTDIKSQNNKQGDKAHTCAQYIATRKLPFERHKEKIETINQLLTDLRINIQITGSSE